MFARPRSQARVAYHHDRGSKRSCAPPIRRAAGRPGAPRRAAGVRECRGSDSPYIRCLLSSLIHHHYLRTVSFRGGSLCIAALLVRATLHPVVRRVSRTIILLARAEAAKGAGPFLYDGYKVPWLPSVTRYPLVHRHSAASGPVRPARSPLSAPGRSRRIARARPRACGQRYNHDLADPSPLLDNALGKLLCKRALRLGNEARATPPPQAQFELADCPIC
jgi:hypothetical protein